MNLIRTLGEVTIPPYVRHLLQLGPKYFPHGPTLSHIKQHLPKIPAQFTELQRVLTWTTYWHQFAPDDPDLMKALPSPVLFPKTGTIPGYSILEALGDKFHSIQQSINKGRDLALLTIEDLQKKPPRRQGIGIRYSILEEFLKDHVIVPADKDGSQVVMKKETYLGRAERTYDK